MLGKPQDYKPFCYALNVGAEVLTKLGTAREVSTVQTHQARIHS